MAAPFPSLRMRLFLAAWGVLWALGLPIVLLYLRRRARKDPDYARQLGERFGRYPAPLPGAVWLHAVSLGEMRSAVPLIRALLAQGERIVTTHFTPAGRREAEAVFGPEIADGRLRAVWVPFEFGFAYRRFFAAFAPRYGLVMEIEIWPRMIAASRRHGVALFMCNAQYPSKSFARDTGRLPIRAELKLGFHQRAGLRRWIGAEARPVIAFASVVEGEDDLMLDAIAAARAAHAAAGLEPPLILYIPRAPERFAAVAGLIADRGLACGRRSDLLDADLRPTGPAPALDLLLCDSLGEMYAWIAMSDRVVVGGGFTPKGSHNISEALALGRPVMVGPDIHTIEYPAVEAIAAGVCRRLTGAADLAAALSPGAPDPDPARIAAFFEAHSGAVARTLAAIPALLAATRR